MHTDDASAFDRGGRLAKRCVGGPTRAAVDGFTESVERADERADQPGRDGGPFAGWEVAVAGAFVAPGAFDADAPYDARDYLPTEEVPNITLPGES